VPNPTEPSPPSRLRRWLGWLPLLVFGLVMVIGYRVWTDRLEASPITAAHAGFLDFMAENSPKARDYRNRYYAKFGRQSVASKHFEQVCAAMLRSAVDDNVDPAQHSAPMANGCKSRGRRYPGVELPD
jgi:hypothetical protein